MSEHILNQRLLRVKRGAEFRLPLFIPVYRPDFQQQILDAWPGPPNIEACMVNAFVLYKQRELRKRFQGDYTLKEHISFKGLLCTDSGAFQGFKRPLLLSNKKIIKFQDSIRTDIAAPIDLITPPSNNRTIAERKLTATQKRIRQGLELVENSTLAGIQQGGRFIELRHRAVSELVEMGVEYLGIGSLVPFFNTNHDLSFVGEVISDAKRVCADSLPMHVYGAGDPLELPFMVHLGANIFDSSSYAHFAAGGWYMTPYGALRQPGPLLTGEFTCPCPQCKGVDFSQGFPNEARLAIHNLWTILHTMESIREALADDSLDKMLNDILEVHQAWFPKTALVSSWRAIQEQL